MKTLQTLFLVFLVFGCVQVEAQNVLASHEFEAKDVSAVSLKGIFCDIYVQQGDQFYFKGRIEGRGDRGDYIIDSRLDGDRVEIWVDNKGSRNWNNRITYSKLELTVPQGTEIRLQNTSGDIYASGLSSSRMRVGSTSGDIELDDISGPLEVSCTSGDIELTNHRGDLEARTTSGDLELSGLSGSLEVGATSGDIEVEQFEGDLWARTTSGEIDLRRGRGAMRLKTTSGGIEGYGLELTADMEVRASSGEVELQLVNDLSDLNFDLESSSGDLRVGSRSAEDEMYIKNNSDGHWVKGTTSSGDLDFSN